MLGGLEYVQAIKSGIVWYQKQSRIIVLEWDQFKNNIL